MACISEGRCPPPPSATATLLLSLHSNAPLSSSSSVTSLNIICIYSGIMQLWLKTDTRPHGWYCWKHLTRRPRNKLFLFFVLLQALHNTPLQALHNTPLQHFTLHNTPLRQFTLQTLHNTPLRHFRLQHSASHNTPRLNIYHKSHFIDIFLS